MADFSVVMDKLQSFETADDIAEFFRGYGIKAHPMVARACAISQFVMEETGEERVSTTHTNVVVFQGYDGGPITGDNTAAMADFITKYDKGVYEDLINKNLYVPDPW